MNTLKGVIAATTYADYQTPLAESDLFIEPWYFVLSSELYPMVLGDATEANISFSEASLISKVKQAIYPADATTASVSFPMARIRLSIEEHTSRDATEAMVSFPQATLRAPLTEYEYADVTEGDINFPEALLRHALIKTDYTPDATEASIEFPEAILYEPN